MLFRVTQRSGTARYIMAEAVDNITESGGGARITTIARENIDLPTTVNIAQAFDLVQENLGLPPNTNPQNPRG